MPLRKLEVILREEPTPIRKQDPKIPRGVAGVIDRALATDTSERYQDATEMKAALEKAL